MTFSHRDHRARRELRNLYLSFGMAVGALALFATLFPLETVRLAAVAGLAAAGTLYVLAVDRLSERYERDLATVRAGQPISGAVRAEVYHEVGFERDREDDWVPSPHHRRPHIDVEPSPPEAPAEGPPPTLPARSDPPSNES